MQRRLALASLCLALLSCGTGPSTNTWSGSIDGVAFHNEGDPDNPSGLKVYAIFNSKGEVIVRGETVVVITEDPNACKDLKTDPGQERPAIVSTDTDGNVKHWPSLWMKMLDHNTVLTDMRGIGDDLKSTWDPGAEPTDLNCADTGCPANWIVASTGTADIISEGNGNAKGDFYLTFKGQQISGDFSADQCSALVVGGCGGCSAAGGLAPGLALLLVGLLRRRRRY